MSQINTNAILDASGGTTTSINGYTPTASNMAGRNRIINGDMRIDQRNAGASSNFGTGGEYSTVDRWQTFENTGGSATNQQVVDAPAGFYNSLKVTVTSSATPSAAEFFQLRQAIEGYNIADLGWGTASAKTVTLSFWVKSSLTGQFGGSVGNNVSTFYSYPFNYTISSANTWEYKTITISGSTAGTWASTNEVGLNLYFNLGCGSNLLNTANTLYSGGTLYRGSTGDTNLVATNGATWQITGVQLEVGSVATPFERRQYGTELQLCQRYYQKWQNESGGEPTGSVGTGTVWTAGNFFCILQYFVPMRALPDGEKSSTNAITLLYNSAAKQATNIVFSSYSRNSVEVVGTSSGMSAGQAGFVRFTGASDYLALTAEL